MVAGPHPRPLARPGKPLRPHFRKPPYSQLRPFRNPYLPVAVASVQSPAGVFVAGKHGAAGPACKGLPTPARPGYDRTLSPGGGTVWSAERWGSLVVSIPAVFLRRNSPENRRTLPANVTRGRNHTGPLPFVILRRFAARGSWATSEKVPSPLMGRQGYVFG